MNIKPCFHSKYKDRVYSKLKFSLYLTMPNSRVELTTALKTARTIPGPANVAHSLRSPSPWNKKCIFLESENYEITTSVR